MAMTMVTKWLLLLALLLSPLAMQPAAAAPLDRASMAMPGMAHCPEPGPTPSKALGECAMACASALPAIETPGIDVALVVPFPVEAAPVAALHGIRPSLSTPPPKAV